MSSIPSCARVKGSSPRYSLEREAPQGQLRRCMLCFLFFWFFLGMHALWCSLRTGAQLVTAQLKSNMTPTVNETAATVYAHSS